MKQRIRARIGLAALGVATALVVLPVSTAGTSAARGGPQKARPAGRIFGVVPASRTGRHPRRSDFAGSAFAAVDNLTYHGGPVMHTNKTYAIYWVPPGYSVSARYQPLIDQYLGDVAAASGSSSNVYASDTQYSDSVNGNILYSAASPDTFGGSYLDTSSLPPDGCVDAYTDVCLSDAQVQAEIQRVAALEGWTPSPTTMFLLFTADNIGSCIDDGSTGVCSYEYYCAYHSNLGTGQNELLYGNIPYADFFFGLFCDAGNQPNGDDADATINLVSHEHNEAITDPLGSAWYDSAGNENGDKCAWDFGTQLGSTQFGPYNQVINGHDYELQQEWSNDGSQCVLTYQQANQPPPPPTVTSTSPSSLAQGATSQNVSVVGSNFLSGASVSFSGTGITVNSTAFVDASHLTANVTVSGTAATGSRDVTVVNPGGGSGSCSGCFSVNFAQALPPTITSFSPSQGRVGTNVTINGTNFNGINAVYFNQTSASYTRVSASKITATVPQGATTGPIEVVATGGIAVSTKSFRVR
jgi:hypothetical protein